MDYYVDITILPDPEFRATVLLNALYTKLHKALCDIQSTNIGVSFPKHEVTLGNILRVHASEKDLKNLQELNWIAGMSGYCKESLITLVPEGAKFRIVSRKQAKTSQAKLRRLIKRGSMLENEAREYKEKMLSHELDSPYVELMSGSSRQKYRRYINHGELFDLPTPGYFDQFGLSKSATIPWF